MFLVDVFCLGVKDALYRKLGTEEFEELLEGISQEADYEQKPAACARKLIEKAVAYAHKLGFSPHRDTRKAWRVMGGVDSKACDCVYTFGSNGKPHYVQGPKETPAFRRHVIRTLMKRCGPGNFDWTVEFDGSQELLDELTEDLKQPRI
jgi:hypothetical protein